MKNSTTRSSRPEPETRYGTLRQLGAIAIIALTCLLAGVRAAEAQSLPFTCTGFTDDPLQPGVTIVKAQHITELRACVDDLHVQTSLARVTWTDLSLSPAQSWIRAVHITELRSALAAVYSARGKVPPQYTTPTLTAQATLIRAVHITEIRQAILLVAGACSPADCGTGPEDYALEFYHLDGVGSVRAVTDETGVVLRRHDYFPFGEADLPAPADDPLRFASKEDDPETGLSYFEARYYRSRSGRFTTVDPGQVGADLFNPQSWNAYAYALNNPVTLQDSSGLDPTSRAGEEVCPTDYCETITVTAKDPGKPTQSSGAGGSGVEVMVGIDRTAPSRVHEPGGGGHGGASGVATAVGSFIMNVVDTLLGTTPLVSSELVPETPPPAPQSTLTKVLTTATAVVVGVIAAKALPALAATTVETFAGSKFTAKVLTQDMVVYRYWGGRSPEMGSVYYTTRGTVNQIFSSGDAARMLNLPPGNTAQNLTAFVVPRGTTVYYGGIAGGAPTATQVVIPNAGALRKIP